MRGSGKVEKIMYELKDYMNAINHKKEDLMAGEDEFWEKKYPAYIVNKALSAFPDCILYVNEMNRMHYLDKRLQFQFFLNSIRPKKSDLVSGLGLVRLKILSMLKNIMAIIMKRLDKHLTY